jgi:hypothetical protein
VIATASAHNQDYARSLGADEVVDYRASKFEDVIRDADAVFDTVGGGALSRSWGVLKPGGKLATIAAAGEVASDDRVRKAFFIVEANRGQLAEVARRIDAGYSGRRSMGYSHSQRPEPPTSTGPGVGKRCCGSYKASEGTARLTLPCQAPRAKLLVLPVFS